MEMLFIPRTCLSLGVTLKIRLKYGINQPFLLHFFYQMLGNKLGLSCAKLRASLGLLGFDYITSFTPVVLGLETIPGRVGWGRLGSVGVGWGVGKHVVIMLSQFN